MILKEKKVLTSIEVSVEDELPAQENFSSENANYEYLQNFNLDNNKEEVTNGHILKKLDRIFMIPMLAVYTLQFLDKVALNYANIMGLSKDLGLKKNEFPDLATSFFVSYIIAEFFQGFFIIPKFPVSSVLGVNVILWGVTTMCCAAPSSFGGMVAVRVLLGITEASVAPCLALITSNFYLKSEGSFRIGVWYSGLGLGQVFGGLLSFLFQLVGRSGAIANWRILFLVLGALNLLVGIYVFLFLPSTPLSSKQLTPKEKYVLLLKLSGEKITMGSNKILKNQIVELIFDVQAWLMLLICTTISFSSSTITTFSSTDIHSFGFNSKETALLNMPSGAVSIISSWVSMYLIMKGLPRYLGISVLLLPAICGAALMSFLPKTNKAGLLIGIYMINTVTPPLAACYSWANVNFAGSTKKAGAQSTFVNVGFALGNILGPQSYKADEAPTFYLAKISMLVTQAASIFFALLIAGIYFLRNKKRAGMLNKFNVEENLDQTWKDLTDFEMKTFKYSY